jgi:hypothetical protein
MALKAFTIWFAGRPGYRSQISYADERIAKIGRTRPAPSVDDIRIVGGMSITGRCWSGATGRWSLASGARAPLQHQRVKDFGPTRSNYSPVAVFMLAVSAQRGL